MRRASRSGWHRISAAYWKWHHGVIHPASLPIEPFPDTAEFNVGNRDDFTQRSTISDFDCMTCGFAPAFAKRGVLETSHGFWLAKEKQRSKIDSAVALSFACVCGWAGCGAA
jgi:hypothetical protein